MPLPNEPPISKELGRYAIPTESRIAKPLEKILEEICKSSSMGKSREDWNSALQIRLNLELTGRLSDFIETVERSGTESAELTEKLLLENQKMVEVTERMARSNAQMVVATFVAAFAAVASAVIALLVASQQIPGAG